MIGPAGYNVTLGQQRADAVKALLVVKAVPPAQIVSSTSMGAAVASAVAAKMPLDRRVEITPGDGFGQPRRCSSQPSPRWI